MRKGQEVGALAARLGRIGGRATTHHEGGGEGVEGDVGEVEGGRVETVGAEEVEAKGENAAMQIRQLFAAQPF